MTGRREGKGAGSILTLLATFRIALAPEIRPGVTNRFHGKELATRLCTAPVAVTSSTLDRRGSSGSELCSQNKLGAKISARRKNFVLLCRTVGLKISFNN